MDRYTPEYYSILREITEKPFEDAKPLKLSLTQFYDFMLERCLVRSTFFPRGNSKPIAIFDMLETENVNPLSVYRQSDTIYLPDFKATWSISKYEKKCSCR